MSEEVNSQMSLTYLYCVLGVAKYRGDWGWEKRKRASKLVLIYPRSSWAKYRFYTMVPLHPLFWLVASILSRMWLLRIAARGCALRPFYCFPSHVIKGWPISQVTLFVFVCFFIWYCLSFQRIKGFGGVSCRFLHSSLPLPSSLLFNSINHVFPCLYFLPVFVQGGRLRPRRGGVDGTGRGSR